MSSRSTALIERVFPKKGFGKRDTHHKYYVLMVDGEFTEIQTRISHGLAEYGDELLAQMAKQLRLKKLELLDFIDCKMSGEDYVALLQEKGELP